MAYAGRNQKARRLRGEGDAHHLLEGGKGRGGSGDTKVKACREERGGMLALRWAVERRFGEGRPTHHHAPDGRVEGPQEEPPLPREDGPFLLRLDCGPVDPVIGDAHCAGVQAVGRDRQTGGRGTGHRGEVRIPGESWAWAGRFRAGPGSKRSATRKMLDGERATALHNVWHGGGIPGCCSVPEAAGCESTFAAKEGCGERGALARACFWRWGRSGLECETDGRWG